MGFFLAVLSWHGEDCKSVGCGREWRKKMKMVWNCSFTPALITIINKHNIIMMMMMIVIVITSVSLCLNRNLLFMIRFDVIFCWIFPTLDCVAV